MLLLCVMAQPTCAMTKTGSCLAQGEPLWTSLPTRWCRSDAFKPIALRTSSSSPSRLIAFTSGADNSSASGLCNISVTSCLDKSPPGPLPEAAAQAEYSPASAASSACCSSFTSSARRLGRAGQQQSSKLLLVNRTTGCIPKVGRSLSTCFRTPLTAVRILPGVSNADDIHNTISVLLGEVKICCSSTDNAICSELQTPLQSIRCHLL